MLATLVGSILLVLAGAANTGLQADDWPSFRGPTRSVWIGTLLSPIWYGLGYPRLAGGENRLPSTAPGASE